jgi:hypothetical protein
LKALQAGDARGYDLPKMVDRRLTLLSLLASVLLGCSGRTNLGESGSECSDGKDNDNDSLVDCQDPDCRSAPICGGRPDAALDGSQDTLPILPDLWRAEGLPPDQPQPVTSYGQRCTTLGTLCPDGKTICIHGKYSPQGVGYCTHGCAGLDLECPEPSGGQAAECAYIYGGSYYCSFMCRYKDVPYTCPTGFGCYESGYPYQKYCWPE